MTAGMRVAAGAPRWSTPLVHVDIRRARSLKRAEDGCACDCAEPEDDVGSLPAEEAVQVEEERERERERERLVLQPAKNATADWQENLANFAYEAPQNRCPARS